MHYNIRPTIKSPQMPSLLLPLYIFRGNCDMIIINFLLLPLPLATNHSNCLDKSLLKSTSFFFIIFSNLFLNKFAYHVFFFVFCLLECEFMSFISVSVYTHLHSYLRVRECRPFPFLFFLFVVVCDFIDIWQIYMQIFHVVYK